MGICKANLGNLMQHWTLCEVLKRLSAEPLKHLHFITTHSMAPWSVPAHLDRRSKNDPRTHFDAARQRLPLANPCVYEAIWHELAPNKGLPYPSSALFATRAWQKGLSLILCEFDTRTADEIEGWLRTPEIQTRCPQATLHEGDWRTLLGQPLVLAQGTDVVLIECDPYRFERNGPDRCSRRNRGVVFPEDLTLLAQAANGLQVPIVVQISSYLANNDNGHQYTVSCITDALQPAGFVLQGQVEADGNMISLVYARSIALWNAPALLGQQFSVWKDGLV